MTDRRKIKRLLNEYLDGEIGMADKAELERVMAANPEVRDEYNKLRRIGMLMSSAPEVRVHPHAFKAGVMDRIENGRSNSLLQPQRVYSMSMLVVLFIIGLAFTFNIYEVNVFSPGGSAVVISEADSLRAGSNSDHHYRLDAGVSAERYFERMLQEVQVGYLDASLMSTVSNQSRVFEGAVCIESHGGQHVKFPYALPEFVELDVTPLEARRLCGIARDLTGNNVQAEHIDDMGRTVTLSDIPGAYKADSKIKLTLCFTSR